MIQLKELIGKESDQIIDPDKKKSKKKEKDRIDPSKYVDVNPSLKEATKGKTAVITFGRMNPITTGHEKLVSTLRSIASRNSADPLIYLSRTTDKNKNPLSYDQKINFAKRAFGDIVIKSNARTIIEVAKELEKKYDNLFLVVGSDRIREFEILLNKYNNREYSFDSIQVFSAGDRDPDADDVSGMSASKMREFARIGDMNSFIKGLPRSLSSSGKAVYDAVRSGMNIKESAEKEKINYFFESYIKAKSDKTDTKSLFRAIKLAENLGANTNYAIKEIEKIKKGLSKNNLVKEALVRSNKNLSEESYQQYTIESRKKPQDKDVKDMPGTQPKEYYKDVPKDDKDARAKHFARQSKKSADDPAAYKPAPGDKDAETKPSKHTNKFKKIFGEANYERACLKRPHMLLNKDGCVVFDGRFKMYRKAKAKETEVAPIDQYQSDEQERKLKEIYELMDAIEFVFESNPKKAIKSKAEKTGISYSILKKVYDRGVAAWRTGHRPGTTPSQWGLARINSFATGGKTRTTADKDLWDQHTGKKRD